MIETPHLPRPAQIESYGNGGFRFADMSHRGSLLCLPDGIWAWPVADVGGLSEASLMPALERATELDFFLIGTGRDPAALPPALRERFRAAKLNVDTMATGAAIRTYNIMLAEGRRVGAALIAVP